MLRAALLAVLVALALPAAAQTGDGIVGDLVEGLTPADPAPEGDAGSEPGNDADPSGDDGGAGAPAGHPMPQPGTARSPADALAADMVAPRPDQGAGADQAPVTEEEAWNAVAERARGRIESGAASGFVLRQLRDELVIWRDRFLAAQGINSGRITTTQAQIDALGPAPAEGATEDPAIAARRADLATELARLRAPMLLAKERHTEASGLIAEIDAIQRGRDASRLTERGVSPLNPAHWGAAVFALVDEVYTVMAETRAALTNTARLRAARASLPLSVLMGLAALLMIWRGRPLTLRVVRWMTRENGRGAWSFIVSLGHILVPFVGLILLSYALMVLNVFGPRMRALIEYMPGIGLTVIMAHWLALHFFDEDGRQPLDLDPARRPRAHWTAIGLGWALAAVDLLRVLMATGAAPEPIVGVVLFPVQMMLAWLLFDFGGTLRLPPRTPEDEELEPVPFAARIASWTGWAARLAALVSVGMAALGYAQATDALLYPAVMTLALLAVVVLLQVFFYDLYAALTRSEAEGLIPVLAGFALVLVAIPLLALIWGVRVDELMEVWARAREGFQIGDTRISPSDFLLFAVVFAIGYLLTRFVQGALRSSVLPKTRLDKGGQNAIVSGTGYIGIFLAALAAITMAGLNLSSLAIVAGALSVGVGFGLQTVVSNFVSGIILLIERPISEGDWIEVGGQMGIVKDISVRSTRIQTFDRTDVIVPNADLVSGVVTNWTRGNSVGRVIVPVGVAYGTDTRKVETILMEVAKSHPMVMLRPEPSVLFQGFGASSLDFEIRAILRDVNWVLSVGSEMRHEIARRFAEEGIEIPFPQQDLWLRNPETLHRQAPKPAQEGTASPAEAGHHAATTPIRPESPEEMPGGGATDGDGDGTS